MLVLASQSPRRGEILRQAGLTFVVKPAHLDETVHDGETPEAYVERLAKEKALAIEAGPGDIVLGADTTVVIDRQILGKPADAGDAKRMLALLSGREHQVITAICLRRQSVLIQDRAVTRVRFRALNATEIADYVATGEPMDKAGAYAIQGLAANFIEGIYGSYTNVVGLPVEIVREHLQKLGGW